MTLDLSLMARIASLYYLEDQSQAEIAKRFGLSRIKVGRLLKTARDVGVVEIRIQTPPAVSLDLESELKRRFGLKQALLAPDQDTDEAQRLLVGRIAAGYLAPHLRGGTVVAVGMGSNVAATAAGAAEVPRAAANDSTFVCAIGGAAEMGAGLNSGDICRQFADLFGGRSEMLYAPAYAETSEVRDTFLGHDDVRRVIEIAAQAQFAVVGIGDAREQSAVVRMGCFSTQDMAQMRQAGAVGDILGYFFDVSGKGLVPGMRDRVITLCHDRLKAIPNVIGVASEDGKAQALLGALRSGILDVLATSVRNARMILDLDLEL